MATIVEFRTAEAKSARRPNGAARTSSCEIVIFPGVRYERWETAPKEKPNPSRRRVKRDTLVLED